MKKLIELKSPKARFARSINVERDAGSAAIDGYLPVGRAIESIERLASALASKNTEVALSVTGPYGSGKSSLALVIDSLLSAKSDPARVSAESMLWDAAPEVFAVVRTALEVNGADDRGFIRAVVTAQRESVARTVVRALLHGASRYKASGANRSKLTAIRKRLVSLNDGLDIAELRPDTRQIRELVRDLSEVAPVLLLIDEFGKNLEAFAEMPGEGDLFLLQELAEWTRDTSHGRLALVTLQHMGFADYSDAASGVQRREWVKIQGRFEDIPFVDTAGQTQALVAAAFEPPGPALAKALGKWAARQIDELPRLGLNELAGSAELLAACWPLHPLSLAALPDLCQRYGQNERTMFSFLASREPRSVATFLADTNFSTRTLLPSVGLDRLYDYFIESAATMVGVSADASRWIEIDTRIRDSQGLGEAKLRVLKTVGLLNLVSTGGSLRASREIVCYAATDGRQGTSDATQVGQQLRDLEKEGLVTFRDFADEFRVWQGSDFDLRTAISLARRRLKGEPADSVLQRVLPQGPVVAARHSHKTGTLRAFERRWLGSHAHGVQPLSADDRGDGLLVYVLGPLAPTALVSPKREEKPVVFATSKRTEPLLDAARELLAIDEVLATNESVRDDWVVRKELSERRVAAALVVRTNFERAFGGASDVTWHWAIPSNQSKSVFKWSDSERSQAVSSVLSDVADAYYNKALPLHNDLMNRHELSSQAAKARREVAEVMASNEAVPGLGIEGFGPGRTLYLSLLEEFGIHGEQGSDVGYWRPTARKGAGPVWSQLVREVASASTRRLNVADLYRTLALPPYGVREGIAPILLIAALRVHSDEFALYEHGTFRPALGGDVCERLLRNPGNFEIKCFGIGDGPRAEFLSALADSFDVRLSGKRQRSSSVVAVISKLVTVITVLPAYSKKTTLVSPEAVAVRRALSAATEPDVLLFEQLPIALHALPVSTRDHRGAKDFQALARATKAAVEELSGAYPKLTEAIRTSLIEHLRPDPDDAQGSLLRRSTELTDKILDPRVRGLATALRADMPDEAAWLAYVAMQVSGVPPEGWTDDDRRRFLTTMQDAGDAFLRIEALTADMRSVGGDFEAIRVQVNSSSGGDLVRLLPVDPRRNSRIDEVLDIALNGLTDDGHRREDARDWLLARLLEWELDRKAPTKSVGGQIYSDDDSKEEETA